MNTKTNNYGYRKLLIWQKGKVFIKLLYKATDTFPRSEVFGLQSQIRRAAISFLLNVVEGNRRKSPKEYLQFLNIAEASLVEVEASLEIALELGFLTREAYGELEVSRKELAIMTRAFVKGINKL